MQIGSHRTRDRSRPAVWAVDDDPDVRKLLRIALQGSGVPTFEILEDGEAVLKRLRSRGAASGTTAPGLVILDVDLPGVDGLEVLRQLREHAATRSAKVVIFTSADRPGARAKARELGAEDWVPKPVDYHDFIAACQSIVRRCATAPSGRQG